MIGRKKTTNLLEKYPSSRERREVKIVYYNTLHIWLVPKESLEVFSRYLSVLERSQRGLKRSSPVNDLKLPWDLFYARI